MKNRIASFAAPLVLLLTGCAGQTVSHYPSLQPRAIEQRSDAELAQATTSVAATDAATDAALDAVLAEHARTLAQTDAGFTPAADAADRATRAARGDAAGGERWITAQTALGKLDALRATTSTAVSDLDEIALGRARDAKPPYPALESLRGRGDAQLTAEINRIASIQALLPA